MAQATDAVWLSVLPDMQNFGKGIVKSAGKQTDAAGKTMGQRIGRGITLGVAAVGAGAAAVGAVLYNVGKTFDEMSDTIAVGTGASGAALDSLVESAKTVGTQVPADFDAIGDAIASLNTYTGATGESLEAMTAQVMDASRMLGEDGAANAALFGQAMQQWQVPAEEGAGKLDALFVATQDYGVGLDQVIGHLNTYGPVLQNAGFSMEESAALFGQLESGGLSVSRIMPGLNSAFRKWAGEGKNAQEELNNTVDAIKNTEDSQEALSIATEKFGAEGAQRLTTAIRNGTLELGDLSTALDDSEGSIAASSDETKSFAEQWELFKNNILVEIEPIATRVFDAIGDGMSRLTNEILPEFKAGWEGEGSPDSVFSRLGETVKSVTDFISENRNVLLGLVGALVAAKVAMVAYNAVMTIARGIMVVKTALVKGWTVAQRVLNTVLRMNPIGLVVTAIMLLVGAFKLAWENSDTFRAIVTAAWEGIKAAASAVWDWLKQAFEWIKDGLSSVGQWFTDRGQDIQDAWNAVKDGISAGWDWIKTKVFDAFTTAISAVATWFTDKVDAIKSVWDGLKSAFKAVWDWIDRNVFQNFMNGIDTVVGWVEDGIGLIGDLWDGLKDLFMAPINWVIREVWNGGIVRVFNAVADVIPGVGPMSEQPEIQARAKGGYTPPGWTLVGEEGPELVNFTRPNRVYTAAETQAMLAGQISNPVQGRFSASNPPHGGLGGWFGDRWEDVKSTGRWVADGVRDAAGNVVKWARGGLAKAAGIVLDPIKSLIGNTLGSSGGRFGEMAGGMATHAIDRVLEWVAGHDEGAAPDAGGRSLRGAKPHVNNAAYALADAVGGIRTMQAFNQSMAGGHPAGKAVDFIDTTAKLNRLSDVISGGGHFDDFNYMAWQGRLWSPGRGWRQQGRGYGNDPQHNWHLHAEWYDQGGLLKPGMSMLANGTGAPEPVLTARQWADISTLAAKGATGPAYLVVRDVDGGLIGRMQVEADGRIAENNRFERSW